MFSQSERNLVAGGILERLYQRVGVSGLSAGQNIGDLTIRQRIYVDVHEIVAKNRLRSLSN